MRIVSLLPSATEIVSLLGLESSLVGISHECDYPSSVADVPRVTENRIQTAASSGEIDTLVRETAQTAGSLYRLDSEALQQLAPDVIITQGLCDVCAIDHDEVVVAAKQIDSSPIICSLSPNSLSEMFQSITQVAEAVGLPQRGVQAVERLRDRVDSVVARCRDRVRKRVLLLEWLDPLFTAGHWNPELVQLAGGESVFGEPGSRSQTISWEDVCREDPDVMVIACCGFSIPRTRQELPTLQSRPGFHQLRCVREKRVHIADGSAYFNRPGPRLVDSLEQLADWLA